MNDQPYTLYTLITLLDNAVLHDPIRIQGGKVWICGRTGILFRANDPRSCKAGEAEIYQGLLLALKKWVENISQSEEAQQCLIDKLRGYWAGKALLNKQIGFREFRRVMHY